MATGLSCHTLEKLGEKLSIDRIDNTRGYVPGNCAIIAACLNRAKGNRAKIPLSAIRALLNRAARVRHGRHTNPTLQVRPSLPPSLP